MRVVVQPHAGGRPLVDPAVENGEELRGGGVVGARLGGGNEGERGEGLAVPVADPPPPRFRGSRFGVPLGFSDAALDVLGSDLVRRIGELPCLVANNSRRADSRGSGPPR